MKDVCKSALFQAWMYEKYTRTVNGQGACDHGQDAAGAGGTGAAPVDGAAIECEKYPDNNFNLLPHHHKAPCHG